MGDTAAPNLQARRIAELQAERDVYERGATREQVDLIDEIARRLRDRDFTCAEIIGAAAKEASALGGDLAWMLFRALPKPDSARSLGNLLEKLSGPVVQRIGDTRDGGVWKLNWPRRHWRCLSEFEASKLAQPVATHPLTGDS